MMCITLFTCVGLALAINRFIIGNRAEFLLTKNKAQATQEATEL
jgi:hypothetical protein